MSDESLRPTPHLVWWGLSPGPGTCWPGPPHLHIPALPVHRACGAERSIPPHAANSSTPVSFAHTHARAWALLHAVARSGPSHLAALLTFCAAGSKSKSIIVSFQGDPSEKPKWLQLWCSAVEAANVDPALAEFRRESLADKFNYEYRYSEVLRI